MNDIDKANYIKALLEEREGCDKRGQSDRLKDIDAELRKVGHEASAPAKRAESRPRATKAKKTETR